jgi:hypothetical protein
VTPTEREQATRLLWNAFSTVAEPDEYDSLADTLGFDEGYVSAVICPIVLDALAPLFDERERRGAEKGWAEGNGAGWLVDYGDNLPPNRNPYRSPQPSPDAA